MVPASILPPSDKKDNEELLYEITHNQRILLCNACSKTNINSTRRLPLNEKIEKIARLIAVANKVDAILDVSQESLYLSKLAQKSISKYNDAEQMIKGVVLTIQEGRTFHSNLPDAKALGESFEKLIEVCSDRLQATSDGNISELLQELSKLRQELIRVQGIAQCKDDTIASLQSQLEQKDLIIAEQDETIRRQNEELSCLTSFQQESFQLCKKYFKTDE